MKTILSTLKAYGRYFLNKIVAIVVLVALMLVFKNLPENNPLPFAELLYVAILITGAVVVAPFVRLLVFPEAAEYAEGNRLRDDLLLDNLSSAYLHYRFATVISYAVALFCFASLSH